MTRMVCSQGSRDFKTTTWVGKRGALATLRGKGAKKQIQHRSKKRVAKTLGNWCKYIAHTFCIALLRDRGVEKEGEMGGVLAMGGTRRGRDAKPTLGKPCGKVRKLRQCFIKRSMKKHWNIQAGR